MKTTERTTLPDKTHEQPVYELKLSRWLVYFGAVLLLLCNGFLWWLVPFPELIKERALGTLIILVMLTLACIMSILMTPTYGDLYFYERHVETGSFLPFVKRKTIYYDKMHLYVRKDGIVILSHFEARPKFCPYTRLRAYHSESINLPRTYDPEILEFVKTKAQSVNYHTPM